MCTRLSCVCHVQVNLRGNSLGDKGWCAIFDTLRDNPQNKIAKWDLFDQGINPAIAKSLAAYMAISTSLTSLDLSYNYVGPELGVVMADALKANASLTTVRARPPACPCPSSLLA